DRAVNELRDFIVEDFSRFYLKFAKQRAVDATKGELKRIAALTGYVLYNISVLLSISAPFCTEYIFTELFSKDGSSIFMEGWPRPSRKLIDEKLEGKMIIAKGVISAILNSREKAGVSLRWPISRAIAEVTDDSAYTALQEMSQIIESYTNAKK